MSASSAEAIREVLHQAECMYMHKSYSSTLQSTQLAQTIHRNPNLIPIERHGEKPMLVRCDDAENAVAAIREAIRAFRESDHNSLGIICKTQEQGETLHEGLARMVGMRIHLTRAAWCSVTA